MDAFFTYAYGTAAALALNALPLILSPSLIVAALAQEARAPTTIEIYFARSWGFALITIGMLTVLLTGSVPLTSSLAGVDDIAASSDPEHPTAPYAMPTLAITLAYHSAMAFYLYAMYMQTSQTSYAFHMVFSGALAALGFWCILFATSNGHISRRTGADKRTSGWPFRNAEADKKRAAKNA